MKRTVTLTDDQVEHLLMLLGYDKMPWVPRHQIDRDIINTLRAAPSHA